MPPHLIVNADDLGLCSSVNSAIFEVYQTGGLTSATLMVNMPGTQDAADRAPDHPGLGIGLHFCITEGRALTGASTLTGGDGAFMSRPHLVKALYSGKVLSGDVKNEFRAQLDRMRELGVAPTHSDSHQHVHMLPGICRAIAPILEEQGLPMRCVDPPPGASWRSWRRPKKAFKQLLNSYYARQLRRVFHGHTNDVLVSIHDLEDEGPYFPATYHGLIQDLPPTAVVEVMVHPYIPGADVFGMYNEVIAAKRPFLDRSFREYDALRTGGIFDTVQLTHYGRLWPAGN